MRVLAAALWALAASVSTPHAARAQAPGDAITAHYNSYRAALGNGDLTRAEREAAAALAASQSRNGDGGVTDVLAINLAQVRLEMSKRAEAYAPALLAFSIAQGGDANVDPLLTRLVLGRAELTEQRWREGRERLLGAIAEAQTRAELDAETYAAASELGHWLFSQEQYASAEWTWAVAREKADALPEENVFARAETRMAHAASLFVDAMHSAVWDQHRVATRVYTEVFTDLELAEQELWEAVNIVGPYAYTHTQNGGLTLAQRLYANAMAWRSLVHTFTQAHHLGDLPDRAYHFRIPTSDRRPFCDLDLLAEPPARFPAAAESAFTTGAVVLYFQLNEDGQEYGRGQVAASIPGQVFQRSVERVLPRWRLERTQASAPNCQLPPVNYAYYYFTFEPR